MSDPLIKKDLVSAYKIISSLGMDDHTYTHLSSRAESKEMFYICQFGLRFGEVAEDTLIKVDFAGNIIEGNEYIYNRTGYIAHSSIYKARQDINHVFHLHTPATVAVSSLKDGLLPISQWALHFYNKVSYHDYNSLALEGEEGTDLALSLGNKKISLLRHHGFITCGKTIQEAMFYTYHLEQACKAQCLALSMNKELCEIPSDICNKSVDDLLSFEEDLGQRDWQAWLRLIEKN